MLSLNNISKSYNGTTFAVNNISFSLYPKDICALIGHNGAGKTTTLKIITGIVKPDAGDVLIWNNSILRNALEAKKNISYVPDKPITFQELLCIEYLNFIADIYNISVEKRKLLIKELSAKLKVENFLNTKLRECSHGTKKKIMIIGALLSQAKLLILDEPLTGLDPESIYILKEILSNYAQRGNIIIFSTHLLDIAQTFCNKFTIINKGILKFTGSLEELNKLYKNNTSLESIFMEIIKDE